MVFRRRNRMPDDPIARTVDPAQVPARYRPSVQDALSARGQFRGLVDTVAPGPLRERLEGLAEQVDAGVIAVWQSVQDAVRLERVVAGLDPERVTEELKRARRSGAERDVDREAIDVLSARFASTQRLINALDELRERVPVLEARLGTAVARAAELVLTSSASAAELDRVGADLDDLIVALGALRAASDELA
jgi:hypothetical protein